MSIVQSPTSRTAYKQYYDLLDRALDSKNGIRLYFNNIGDAKNFRVRLNYARTMDREHSQAVNNPGDPGYGFSAYDMLVISAKGDEDSGELTIKHNQIPTKITEIEA